MRHMRFRFGGSGLTEIVGGTGPFLDQGLLTRNAPPGSEGRPSVRQIGTRYAACISFLLRRFPRAT